MTEMKVPNKLEELGIELSNDNISLIKDFLITSNKIDTRERVKKMEVSFRQIL